MEKRTFEFTLVKKVEVEVMSEEEISDTLKSWGEEKSVEGLAKFNTRHSSKTLKIWGEEGSRKALLLYSDGSIHKIWYYTKWGWSEA